MVSAYENREDVELLHQELLGLLHELRADLVVAAALEARIRYRLFATSALGSPPDATALGTGGISPFRVLDVLQGALTRKVDPGEHQSGA